MQTSTQLAVPGVGSGMVQQPNQCDLRLHMAITGLREVAYLQLRAHWSILSSSFHYHNLAYDFTTLWLKLVKFLQKNVIDADDSDGELMVLHGHQ